MRRLVTDVRVALRQTLRSPSFGLLAALLLSIGIGGAAAVFSVLNLIYYRPMPYPSAERLALLTVSLVAPDCDRRCARDPNPREVAAWAQEAGSIERLGSIAPMQAIAHTGSGAMVLEGATVSAGILDILAPQPLLGRGLVAADFEPGADKALVLSHSAWTHVFAGDSSLLGRRIVLGDESYAVVGVLRPQSELGPPLFSLNVTAAQFWIARDQPNRTGSSMNRTIARVRSGVDLDGLRSQLDVVLKRHGGATWSAGVQSLRDAVSARYRSSFWYLLAAVALLLTITCLNVGGLFLARLNDRAPELATRVALGATRTDLARQLLVEAALIAGAGGLGGCLIAYYGVVAARLLPPGRLPAWDTVALDGRVLVVVLALTIVATTAIVLAPLIVFGPERLLVTLRERTSAGAGRARVRSAFVAVQVALSLILLASAGTLARLLLNAELRDIGMAKHSLVYVQLQRRSNDADAASALTTRLIEEMRRIPGVLSVAAEGVQARGARRAAPPGSRDTDRDAAAMTIDGSGFSLTDAIAPRSATEVTADYFSTLGITVARGRAFGPADGPTSPPVAILDEPTARRMFPGASAIGRRVKFGGGTSDRPWLTIVGVASAVQADPLETNPQYRPQLYRSALQFPAFPTSVLVKVAGQSYRLAPELRRAVGRVDPTVAVANIISVEDSLGRRLWEARFNALILAAFAVLALVLACCGIYAAVSYVVSARQRELAVRIALGATRAEVLSIVIRSGASMLAPGLALGLIGSLGVNRVLKSLLYGATSLEPSVLITVFSAILVTSFLATWLPARRAAAIEPASLLRSS